MLEIGSDICIRRFFPTLRKVASFPSSATISFLSTSFQHGRQSSRTSEFKPQYASCMGIIFTCIAFFFSSDKAMAPCNCRCKVLARLQNLALKSWTPAPLARNTSRGIRGAQPSTHALTHTSSEPARAGAAASPLRSQSIRFRVAIQEPQPCRR